VRRCGFCGMRRHGTWRGVVRCYYRAVILGGSLEVPRSELRIHEGDDLHWDLLLDTEAKLLRREATQPTLKRP
jgi:hypothetical protein